MKSLYFAVPCSLQFRCKWEIKWNADRSFCCVSLPSSSSLSLLSCPVFNSISLGRPLCSLMFYLISHNKASLWTAINCVWIFPVRRNRELSERAPVPQAAFILMQRSIAILIARINHSRHCCFIAGATSERGPPDNITAEVCTAIHGSDGEERGGKRGPQGAFRSKGGI